MSDKTIILKKGKLEQFDKLVNIYKYPKNEYCFSLGNSNIIQKKYIPSIKYYFHQESTNEEMIYIATWNNLLLIQIVLIMIPLQFKKFKDVYKYRI